MSNSNPRAAYKLKSGNEKQEDIPEPMTASTRYALTDRLDAWTARWGINRMAHKVLPGLYRSGTPDGESPVLVTSNYRMTFDLVRREFIGRNIWLLVLDTKGINVWCAAGKGTFGTAELVKRIRLTGLSGHVTHRTLVLPQLGATGISAREVRRLSGFRVVFGPIRAVDIPAFLDAGMKATPEMRKVRFSTWDRLVLTPIELVGMIKPTLILFGILFLIQLTGLARFGTFEASAWFMAILAGTTLTPILLPWVPGRAFAVKGLLVGLIAGIAMLAVPGSAEVQAPFLAGSTWLDWLQACSALLFISSVSSFTAMNFTGCTTYTSPSGVLKEMKTAIPAQAASFAAGCLGLLVFRVLEQFV